MKPVPAITPATPKDYLIVSLLALATAVASTSLAAPARAQMPGADNPAVQAAIKNCQADRTKFCPSVEPGGGRIVRCLMQNADALTPACRTALNDARTAIGSAALPR